MQPTDDSRAAPIIFFDRPGAPEAGVDDSVTVDPPGLGRRREVAQRYREATGGVLVHAELADEPTDGTPELIAERLRAAR